ncbi:MAG: transporter substrate-binding domain-containing protein [Muribaculaceae bacterium]|nr:transporter substrate-binding domain-containing protein [Muribaculaceae bacterium]
MKQLKTKPVGLYLVLLAVTLAAMFGLKNCGRSNGRADSGAADTLRVAIQYAPGSFHYDGDSLAGLDYEALKALDIPFRLYPITNPAEGLRGLKQGRYDLVIADMPQTADSAEDYIFTDPIYFDRQVLVQRGDSLTAPITSPIELGGKTVVVPQGSPIVTRLRNLSREIGDTIYVIERPATAERLLTELALGADSVPLTVANSLIAQQIAAEYPALNCSIAVSLNQLQPWILAPADTALRAKLNAKLAKLPKNH